MPGSEGEVGAGSVPHPTVTSRTSSTHFDLLHKIGRQDGSSQSHLHSGDR